MGKNIAVLASGSGTNAENIIRYFREKGSARVALVLTNRQNAFVLERAKGLGVPCVWFAKSDWESGELVLSTLRFCGIGRIPGTCAGQYSACLSQ